MITRAEIAKKSIGIFAKITDTFNAMIICYKVRYVAISSR